MKSYRTLKKRRNKYLNTQTFANPIAQHHTQTQHSSDQHSENRYPAWMYNSMVHEQAQIMEDYLQQGASGE